MNYARQCLPGLAMILALVLTGTGCRAVPLESYYDARQPAAIEHLAVDDDGVVTIRVRSDETVTARLLRADGPQGERREAATLKSESGRPTEWTDPEKVSAPGIRYYSVGVKTGGGTWVHDREWAVVVQERKAGRRYLVSVPVDLGDQNTLHGELGRQLGRGLRAGTMAGEGADHIEILDADGTWKHYHWIEGPDYKAWWDLESTTLAKAVIEPGAAFWIECDEGEGRKGHGVFYGRTLSGDLPVRFKANETEGTPFGITVSRPLYHRNTETSRKYSTLPNQLGFAVLGSGGKTSDHRKKDESGDQIWVWRNNEWQGYYWLMDHVGPAWNGRWWDNRTRDFADFALEPGMGYYYRHRVNRWGGEDFVWQPPDTSTDTQ